MALLKLALFLSLIPFSIQAACEAKGPNLVLFTWDGVRPQEFFKGTDTYHRLQLKRSERGKIFTRFWHQHARDGVVLGKKPSFRLISPLGVSLPSYQSLMIGKTADCRNNQCGQVKEETVLEKIQRELNLSAQEVAVFASWEGIKNAVAKNPDQLFTAIYPDLRKDEFLHPEIVQLQAAALKDMPTWHGSRKDHYTFEASLLYLKHHCPRVLYISLVDSDEFGHSKDYPGYVKSLRTYDEYLDRLMNTLKDMGEYGKKTTLILTTDHSRGAGPLWSGHGFTEDSEKDIFLFMTGAGVGHEGKMRVSGHQGQIRPTMEYLMGLGTKKELLPGLRP